MVLPGQLQRVTNPPSIVQRCLPSVKHFRPQQTSYLCPRVWHLNATYSKPCRMLYWIWAFLIIIYGVNSWKESEFWVVISPLVWLISVKLFVWLDLQEVIIIIIIYKMYLASCVFCFLQYDYFKYALRFGIIFYKVANWLVSLNTEIFSDTHHILPAVSLIFLPLLQSFTSADAVTSHTTRRNQIHPAT